MPTEPLKLFISYSHRDEPLREELGSHLRILERQQLITIWHDRKILAGDEWDHQINTSLETADIVLLLISSDFLASSYCWDIEIQRAMQLHESGQACVIPVILRSVDWTSAPFGKLQAVPKNAQPVTLQPDRDAAFEFVTKQIRQVAMELIAKREKQREQGQKAEAIARYRKQFEEFAEDGEISFGERFVLDKLKQDLGLSDSDVQAIEQTFLRPTANQQALDQYRQLFEEAIVKYGYPFNAKIAGDLKLVQTHLGLTDADVAQVEVPIIAKKEAEQQKQQQLQQRQQELEQQQDEERQRREQEQAKQRRRQEEAKRQLQREAEELRRQKQLRDKERQEEAKRQLQREAEELRTQKQRLEKKTQQVNEQEQEPNSYLIFQPYKFQIGILRVQKEVQSSGLMGLSKREVITFGIDCKPGRARLFVEDMGNGIQLEMVKIPGGTFQMGSPESEEGRSSDEDPQHKVTIQPFFLGKFTITQEQWKAIAALPKVSINLDPAPASFVGSDRPVESVSWLEAVEFCDRLSRKTNRNYRLPSEAEWEYACRAGTNTPFHFGETITTDLANYQGTDFEFEGENYPGKYGSGPKGQYREQTTSVGSFAIANAFGLYDMHGNILEWCADYWHENYQGAPIDGSAWTTSGDSSFKLLRGGSWFSNPGHCRSANRSWYGTNDRGGVIGFRLALSLPGL